MIAESSCGFVYNVLQNYPLIFYLIVNYLVHPESFRVKVRFYFFLYCHKLLINCFYCFYNDDNWSQSIYNLWFYWCSLAEFKQELFEDEDGSSGAEDDERLAAEKTEDRAGQSCTQEALHHTLLGGEGSGDGVAGRGLVHTETEQEERSCCEKKDGNKGAEENSWVI